MPLPATHLQPVQAAVKMVTAPDLSLRGRFAPVAISGRHLQSVQSVDKTHGPIASVAALSERHWQSQIWRHSWRTYNALKFVIARPRRGRGNLGKAVTISPMAFPRSSRVLRDCHVGLWPPRNDKSGSWSARRKCSKTCNCQWRSLTAATDAIGFYVFIDSRYKSAVQSRERHVAPLQRTFVC